MILFGSISTVIGVFMTLYGIVTFGTEHLYSGNQDYYMTMFILIIGLILAVMGIVFLVVGFARKSSKKE